MIRAYSILFIAMPFGSFALAMFISMIIPGCTVNEGSGATGCGPLGPLLSIGVWLGFSVLIFGLIGLVPIGIIAAAINLFSGKTPYETQPRDTCENVTLDAVLQYKKTGSTSAKCPRCSTPIRVVTDPMSENTINMQCGCGGCNGKYMLHAIDANALLPNGHCPSFKDTRT